MIPANAQTRVRWNAHPAAIDEELARLAAIPFFHYESHLLDDDRLKVVGVISRKKKYGGTESMRVRMEYPDDFPDTEPVIFDHDHVYQPGTNGHLFNNHSLCLAFFDREDRYTFELGILTKQILDASLCWLMKRNIFERTRKWPGPAEEHGYARPYATLAQECASDSGIALLQLWTAWAIATRTQPNLNGPCPCVSGSSISRCHVKLATLIDLAVWHGKKEGAYGNR